MKQFKILYNQFLKMDKCNITDCIYLIMAPVSVLGVLLFLSSSTITIRQEAEKSAGYKIGSETSQKIINPHGVFSKIEKTLQKVNTIEFTFLSSSN